MADIKFKLKEGVVEKTTKFGVFSPNQTYKIDIGIFGTFDKNLFEEVVEETKRDKDIKDRDVKNKVTKNKHIGDGEE